MARTDHSSAIALVLSLLLHGSVLYVCTEVANDMPAHRREERAHAPLRPVRSRIMVESPSTPPEHAAPAPMPEPPTAAPLPEPELAPLRAIQPKPIIPLELAPEQKPLALPTDGFGELTGSADANAMHSLSGDVPMQALKAEQDQPYISRDPTGTSPPADKPKEAKTAGAENATPPREARKPAEERPEVTAEKPKPTIQALPPAPAEPAKTDPTRFGPALGATQPSERPVRIAMAEPQDQPLPKPTLPKPGQAASPGTDRERGEQESASAAQPGSNADPAPQTDSESDPFSVQGSAEFRPGKVVARFGRKVKTVRPRLSLAGQYDLISVASPNVVMRVRADETGRVREVKVVQSSGSREVDQPCELAMYEWWFEPPRDAKGNPRPAEMVWTISFRSR